MVKNGESAGLRTGSVLLRKLLGSELFEIPVSEIPRKKFSFNSFLVSLFFSPQISQIIVPSFYFFFLRGRTYTATLANI